MFADYDRSLNLMSITDQDVAADWRNGLLRNVANILIEDGSAVGIIFGSWGAINGYETGTLAEHFYGTSYDNSHRTVPRGHNMCQITSITNVEEYESERFQYDSFGPGISTTEVVIRGNVTCEHDVTGSMSFTTSMSNLIYQVASLNNQ